MKISFTNIRQSYFPKHLEPWELPPAQYKLLCGMDRARLIDAARTPEIDAYIGARNRHSRRLHGHAPADAGPVWSILAIIDAGETGTARYAAYSRKARAALQSIGLVIVKLPWQSPRAVNELAVTRRLAHEARRQGIL